MQLQTGRFKGLNIQVPKGVDTRPTLSRVRAAVLNSLQMQLAGAAVLDLFAGSGAFGIEALSRGADSAVFVEKDRVAVQCLRRNLAELARRDRNQEVKTKVLTESAGAACSNLRPDRLFDIVWGDPPYGDALTWLETLAPDLLRVLASSGTMIWESSVDDSHRLSAVLTGKLQIYKQKQYSDTCISYLQLSEDEHG